MLNNFVKINRTFNFRSKTNENNNKINKIVLNKFIINRSLSTNKYFDKTTKSKTKINKKIGIPISPNINFNYSNKLSKNNSHRSKSGNASTTVGTNKTKNSKISNISSSNIKPFIIFDEYKNKIEKNKNPIIQKEDDQDYIRLSDIFHLNNYQTNLNQYSKIKPKFTHYHNKKN